MSASRTHTEIPLSFEALHEFLEEKHDRYNRPDFIESDPIVIPHRFTRKEDIEIAGFLAATIAWGQRKSIIANATRLMAYMGESPYDFIINFNGQRKYSQLAAFCHRTFNGTDCLYFMQALQHLYRHHGGPEGIFTRSFAETGSAREAIVQFHRAFFEPVHPGRTRKHVSDPSKGSSAKRLNMYLRWMVRQDKRGVDFGIWKGISPALLVIPLDVHTGSTGRQLGLFARKQNDWKAVEEYTAALRQFDPNDPVKYDFALFGLGIYEGF